MRYVRNRPPLQFLTRAEAAEHLKVSLRTVSRYQREGRLRFDRIGGRTCILREDVLALKREPPRSQSRVERRQLQLLSQRIMCLELDLARIIEAMDEELHRRTQAANASE